MSNYECPESEFGHAWEAGMMHVHSEDAHQCAIARAAFGETVECGRCGHVYDVTEN